MYADLIRWYMRHDIVWDGLFALLMGVSFLMAWTWPRYRGNLPVRVGLTVFLLFVLAARAHDSLPFYQDYAAYFSQGDAYVHREMCVVSDYNSTTAGALLYLRFTLYCQGGKSFNGRYRLDLLRQAVRWAEAHQTVVLRYLPRSHLILDAGPVWQEGSP